MGTKLCSCEGNDNQDISKINKPKIETNLSQIEKYSYLKKSNNMPIFVDEYRTKAGTEWDKLTGLEKIILLYKINFIIVKYREHLKKKKQNKINS